MDAISKSRDVAIAALAVGAIVVSLLLRVTPAGGALVMGRGPLLADIPLIVAVIIGGLPLVGEIIVKLSRREFSIDVLAACSIATALVLQEFLAGAFVVLMLSGGAVLERFAVGRASSSLLALSKRAPTIAHRRVHDTIFDVPLDEVEPGEVLVVYPHEICPVDGTVVEGVGDMDEAYLTGEPYLQSKVPGSPVVSGAINGEAALVIRTDAHARDSRYAKIVQVLSEAEKNRPRIRRIADQLGAFYSPFSILVAVVTGLWSQDAHRFLAVLVVATPCPLLIAVPVAIVGGISLAARRGSIVRNPAVLEQIALCRTIIFDKTGTLTYATPELVEQSIFPGYDGDKVLQMVATLEQYSRHPLARAVVAAADAAKLDLLQATEVSERPGTGLSGQIGGHRVHVTSRQRACEEHAVVPDSLPERKAGLECAILVDGVLAAIYWFRDTPRRESRSFIAHLGARHGIQKVMIVSGDSDAETRYLAGELGISEVYASKSPEEKLAIVRAETAKERTIYVGDGINDAPALTAATVGIAFGERSDVTTEAAAAVVLDSSLAKVDELLHIGIRMRRIALESAVGGMMLSIIGMLFASVGLLTPVMGAVIQEVIDVVVILNALRAATEPHSLVDFE